MLNDFQLLIDQMILSEDSSALNFQRHCFDSVLTIKNEFLNTIDGDIVECGVYRGIMISFLSMIFPHNTIWACDSYEGCPTQSSQMMFLNNYKEDIELDGGHCIADETYLIKNLEFFGNKNNVNIIKGWFKDTLHPKNCPIKKISLLRIDVDMYSSTMEVLTYLYPRVVNGGIIILDDFGLSRCRKAVLEYISTVKDTLTFYEPETCNVIDINDETINFCGQGIFLQKNRNTLRKKADVNDTIVWKTALQNYNLKKTASDYRSNNMLTAEELLRRQRSYYG